LLLTTGRVAEHWHTLTRTGKSAALRAAAREPRLELHPDDAVAAGVGDGDRARVVSRRGTATARVALTTGIPPGVAFVPFHWGALHLDAGAGAVNATTHRATDPTSYQPELKALAVRVEPVAAARDSAPRHAGALTGPSRPARGPVRRVVVVGTGMSGLAVVEELLRRRPADAWRIVMLGEEPGPAYNRILVSKLLAGSCGPGDLVLKPAAWYAQHGVDLRGGCPAAAIDPDARVVTDVAGGRHRYDALVLATGSRPLVPPIAGADLPHVCTLRTLGDVDAIAAGTPAARAAVVVGGGLLGLEAAAALRARGVPTTVVELADRLMAQQLDGGAAAMLGRGLAALRLRAELARSVAAVEPGLVRLDDGRELRADLVVVAAGVRPETGLARATGLECDRGVLVDDAMRTSAPGILATGECAQHRGTVYALWAPLAEQARVAAATVAGDPAAFLGATPATTLKVAGVDVFAGGASSGTDGDDEVVLSDSRRGVYRKLVLREDRLRGAVLVGDLAGARRLSELLRSQAPVPDELLAPTGGDPAPAPPDGIVCSCNQVTRAEIEDAIRARALRSVAQVGNATRAATGCGSCARDVQALLDAHSSDRAREESVVLT
jgi:ferredoxin-nitrate reductase